MNQLSNYATLLELEAELQRVALGTQLAAGRSRSAMSLLLPELGTAASWLVKSRGGWRIGVIWVASGLLSYWRQRKQQRT
jgi:hypothetical protein